MKRVKFSTALLTIAGICLVIILYFDEDCDFCYSDDGMALKFIAAGLVLIVGVLYYVKIFKEHEAVAFNIESLPLSKADRAVEGTPFAGNGIVEGIDGKILEAPYSKAKCVYYHSILEKEVGSGKNRRWVIVTNNTSFYPFAIKDDRGSLKVDLANMDDDFSGKEIQLHNYGVPDPQHSEIDCRPVMVKEPYRGSDVTKIFGIPLTNPSRLRRSEYVLEPGSKVFVCGYVDKGADGRPHLREDVRCPLIISRKDRDAYVKEFYEGELLIYYLCLLIAVGYSAIVIAANRFLQLAEPLFYMLLLGGVVLILASALFIFFNRIITLKNRALNALSNIEVELKRRNDLIPSIVQIVRQYSAYEQEIQNFVAQSRASVMAVKNFSTHENRGIPALIAIVEKYPDLKASENFIQLMRVLSDTENRIAYSREFYNRSIQKYNTLIEQFPGSIVASAVGFKNMDYIDISRDS